MPKIAEKILIVEDEISIINPLQIKLKKEGFQVLTADNGKKGLAVALKERPDLILLDIVMPVMDGLTMLEKLKEDKIGRKINIVILTNLTQLGGEQSFDKRQVADYLVKSEWKIDDLIKKIRLIVKK